MLRNISAGMKTLKNIMTADYKESAGDNVQSAV